MNILAPAKINLSLRILGTKSGYHLLNSLVGFLDFSDHLHLSPNTESGIKVIGANPTLDPEDNIALKALRRLEEHGITPHHITLWKHIYSGAGLGGGSADAAAILRALGQGLPRKILDDIALELGADVPVCLLKKPTRMEGIGEKLSPIADFPIKHLLLAAPNATLSTALVFQQKSHIVFSDATTDPMQPETWHNDLETAACSLCPSLKPLLSRLRTLEHILVAGMSGTGVCCFAALPCVQTRRQAIATLRQEFPDVRFRAATLLGAHNV